MKEKKALNDLKNNYNTTNEIAHGSHTLTHYIHSQYIIDMATLEFLLPLRNTHTSINYQKYASETAFSTLLLS